MFVPDHSAPVANAASASVILPDSPAEEDVDAENDAKKRKADTPEMDALPEEGYGSGVGNSGHGNGDKGSSHGGYGSSNHSNGNDGNGNHGNDNDSNDNDDEAIRVRLVGWERDGTLIYAWDDFDPDGQRVTLIGVYEAKVRGK